MRQLKRICVTKSKRIRKHCVSCYFRGNFFLLYIAGIYEIFTNEREIPKPKVKRLHVNYDTLRLCIDKVNYMRCYLHRQ